MHKIAESKFRERSRPDVIVVSPRVMRGCWPSWSLMSRTHLWLRKCRMCLSVSQGRRFNSGHVRQSPVRLRCHLAKISEVLATKLKDKSRANYEMLHLNLKFFNRILLFTFSIFHYLIFILYKSVYRIFRDSNSIFKRIYLNQLKRFVKRIYWTSSRAYFIYKNIINQFLYKSVYKSFGDSYSIFKRVFLRQLNGFI